MLGNQFFSPNFYNYFSSLYSFAEKIVFQFLCMVSLPQLHCLLLGKNGAALQRTGVSIISFYSVFLFFFCLM